MKSGQLTHDYTCVTWTSSSPRHIVCRLKLNTSGGQWSQTFHIKGTVSFVMYWWPFMVVVPGSTRWGEKVRMVSFICCGRVVQFVSVYKIKRRELWVVHPSVWLDELQVLDVLIHISVSATGVWECPLVVGAWLVPLSGGDSPLGVGLSMASCWGKGATDTRVLAWFSSSTWKDSAYRGNIWLRDRSLSGMERLSNI